MNSYPSKDITRPLAVLFSITFALIFSVRFYQAPHLLFLLLAFRFWVMSGFLVNRFPSDQPVLLHQRLIAYVSKFIPFFYHAPLPSASRLLHAMADPLSLVGAFLSTWAIIDLGRRFGVAPAKRGDICRTGLYRWFRHPIYLGYALVELGGMLLNRSNLPIFILSMGLLVLRAHMENKIVNPKLTSL